MLKKLLLLLVVAFSSSAFASGFFGSSGGGGASIGGLVVGGSDNSVLFINPAGVMDEDNSNFSYDKSTSRLNLGGRELFTLSADPTSGAGVSAPVGSLGMRSNSGVGELWLKTGSSATSWNFVYSSLTLPGALHLEGAWDASGNSPSLTTAPLDCGETNTVGDFYIVSTAGTTDLDGIASWSVGDNAVCGGDGTWFKIDNAQLVTSVNGQTGAIVLDTDSIDEGATNLYYTDARARGAVSASSPLSYNSTTGDFSLTLGSANQLLGVDAGATASEYKTLSGTTNQVSVTHGVGTITLGTPQDIATSSTPTFAGLTIGTLDGPLRASSGTVSAGNIDAATELSNAVPIANGGTGQTSKTSAFDALSPLAAKGDLIVFDGTNNVAVSAGTDGYGLIADSTSASGVRWGSITVTLPTTTKGDLLVHNGTTDDRLPVGTDGQALVADSAETLGVKWATPEGGGAYVVYGSRASPTSVTSALGINSTSDQRALMFIQGFGGAVDIAKNPQISAGTDVGQEIQLICRSNTNTVLFEDGNGLDLNGSPYECGDGDGIKFVWDGTNWWEESRR